MADNTHIQLIGDEIHPIKTSDRVTAYSTPRRDARVSLSEKNSHDIEHGLNKTDEDMNRKKKQEFNGWVLLWLSYQSIGVIYGDIGTSPLYVYSSTFSTNPSYDDLLGALSLIIWTLTLIVSIKYIVIVLRADDDGEGGTFALYSLLSKYANIIKRDPNVTETIRLERYMSSDLKPTTKTFRAVIENSRVAKAILEAIGVMGVSLVMADGVLTPAQSVLGAIQGLNVAHPGIDNGVIVGVSCVILVMLFLVQPFGTSKLASSFAPIVIIWLVFNMSFGIYNLVKFDHSVLKAFSPFFAGDYFVRNKTDGWKSLGGILLAFTGVEALFADLGAFSRRSIQLSWLFFAYPCLLLAYIGQAAYISVDPTGEAFSNPFFNTVPPGMFFPSLVIAILAAIVASQAMITSTFQLLSQIMKLSYFPHIKLVHTSKRFHGQIYVPLANWLLMIGTVLVTAVYNNTTKLGHAYGVCVVLVTFITTCMVSIVALIIWRIHFLIVLFFFLIFGTLDAIYLSSALTKIPDGAWFTLALALLLSSVFILWRFGKEQQWRAEGEDRFQPSHLITTDPSGCGELRLTEAFGGNVVTKVRGIGVFFDKAGNGVPIVFAQFVRKFEARPEIMIFFHMRPLYTPSIAPSERYVISRTSIPGCYRVTIRHGYSDEIVTDELARLLLEQLTLFITTSCSTASSEPDSSIPSIKSNKPLDADVSAELQALQKAYDAQIVYIVGKEQMRVKAGANVFKRAVLELFLWLRENSRAKIASMKIPVDQLVEVGFVKEI